VARNIFDRCPVSAPPRQPPTTQLRRAYFRNLSILSAGPFLSKRKQNQGRCHCVICLLRITATEMLKERGVNRERNADDTCTQNQVQTRIAHQFRALQKTSLFTVWRTAKTWAPTICLS